jgi:NTP pyrophosphatase (non-canonical NTP hydrolase)
MDLNEYQKFADSTAIYPNRGHNLPYVTLGLAGEAGEVAEKVKKLIRDREGVADAEYKREIAKEMGDVLWYIAEICSELGIPMEDVMKMNIEKLSSRKERGVVHGDGDNR